MFQRVLSKLVLNVMVQKKVAPLGSDGAERAQTSCMG